MSLVLQDVGLTQEGLRHLDGISAEFMRGELTTIIGRTLAGKTTLMRALAGLQGIDSGEIRLDGRRFDGVPAWRRDVAMVYQQFINYPHLSVFENVAFPLRKRGLADAEVVERVETQLQTVGLAQFARRRPAELSGGQQQRVALARALVRHAPILLLDEPLVNLDYKLREQLRDEFRQLLARHGDTIVLYNTTEPAEAMMLGDRVIVLHEGRVLQSGRPSDIFDRPASALVAGIVNDPPMNLIAGEIAGGAIRLDGGIALPVARHLERLKPDRYRFGVRANELALAAGGTPGRVTFSEVSGSESFFYFDAPFGSAVIQVEGVHSVTLGDAVAVGIDPDRLYCFAAEGDGVLAAAPETSARGRN